MIIDSLRVIWNALAIIMWKFFGWVICYLHHTKWILYCLTQKKKVCVFKSELQQHMTSIPNSLKTMAVRLTLWLSSSFCESGPHLKSEIHFLIYFYERFSISTGNLLKSQRNVFLLWFPCSEAIIFFFCFITKAYSIHIVENTLLYMMAWI